ncbi:hypothetical protein D3Z36_02035 [Lachnospiraceae bacterium]|nr:hypothetical protein [Lachnospiraceae bacterium]
METKKQNMESEKTIFENTFHKRIEDLNKNLLDEEYKILFMEYLYFLQELTRVYGKTKWMVC